MYDKFYCLTFVLGFSSCQEKLLPREKNYPSKVQSTCDLQFVKLLDKTFRALLQPEKDSEKIFTEKKHHCKTL